MGDKLVGEDLGAENIGSLIQMWRYSAPNLNLLTAGASSVVYHALILFQDMMETGRETSMRQVIY